jgi:hypothetical protein
VSVWRLNLLQAFTPTTSTSADSPDDTARGAYTGFPRLGFFFPDYPDFPDFPDFPDSPDYPDYPDFPDFPDFPRFARFSSLCPICPPFAERGSWAMR